MFIYQRNIRSWHLHKIPKVLHLYWGVDDISFLRHITVVSFRKHNPDWLIKIHTPKDVYKGNPTWETSEYSLGFKMSGQYLEKLQSHDVEFIEHDFASYGFSSDVPETFKADYLRYRLLSTEGGIWSDFDILYFRPITMAAFNNPENSETDTGLFIENGLPHISFLFSSVNNPVYAKLEVLAKEKLDLARYQSIGAELFALPDMQLDQFPIKLCKIDKNSIYYFEWKHLPDIFVNDVKYPDDAVGIHCNTLNLGIDCSKTLNLGIDCSKTLNLGIDCSISDLSQWHLTKIPKVLHLYWGGQNLSYLRHLTVVSFRQYNPDWKIKIHRPLFPYDGNITWSDTPHSEKGLATAGDYAYIEKLKESYVEFVDHDFEEYGFKNNIPETYKADYLRYLLLSTEGGVWSDFDILYFRSINSVALNNVNNINIDMGVCIFEDGLCPIGFLFGCAGNPVYAKLEVLAKQRLNLNRYQSIGADLFFLPEMELKKFKEINVGLISKNTVYALDWNRTKDIFINNVPLEQDSIGIHWYAGDLIAQQFNQIITPHNVAYGNSTLSNTIMNYVDVKIVPKPVSVLIPSFNRTEQLRWNLFSLANQKTDFEFEVIVINDGYDDNETQNICRLYNKRLHIKYLFTGQRNNSTPRKLIHQGANQALEAGLSQAVGQTIVIAGAEIFMTQRDVLDRLVNSLQYDPNVVATTHVIDDIDGALLQELNDNFGSLNDIEKDKQILVFRDNFDCLDKPYVLAYQRNLDKSTARILQIDANVIHLHHRGNLNEIIV